MFLKKKHLLRLKRSRAIISRTNQTGLLLDRNERFVEFEKKINQKLLKEISKIKLGLYPELSHFYKLLSNWLKLPTDQIYITEGVSGAIKSLIETIAIPGKSNIIFPHPTFALYPVYCKMFNLKFKTIGYNSNYQLNWRKIFEKIDNKTSIVFLPNPNIPIEGLLNLKELEIIAKKCLKKKIILVLDEVYYPYGNISGIKLIKKYSNIFIMRSFSKSFGLAGIRLGYLISSKKNIEYVSKTRTGYETNSLSITVATFFIKNYKYIKNYIKDVRSGLKFLKKNLNKLDIENNGGEKSNFIFLNFKSKKLKNVIDQELKKKNIYVRSNWPKPYEGGFLVSGAPKKIMKKFLFNLKKIYNLKNKKVVK